MSGLRRNCGIAAVVIALVAAAIWIRGGGLSRAPIIAILDTGIAMDADSRFSEAVVGSEVDRRDLSGHGTQLARIILNECPKCRILPIRVAEGAATIRPADLVQGVTRAIEGGATVINISNGVLVEDALDDDSSFKSALAKKISVVVAAGHGVPNPFRPLELAKLFPQRLDGMIVVAAADANGKVDPRTNFGPELDFAVTAEGGSSFAAATLSAWIAATGRIPEEEARMIRDGRLEYRWIRVAPRDR